jgi:hypothetical protein
MRYSLLLLLPALFVSLSCKKVHYGYWSALFRFDNGEVWDWSKSFHLEKKANSFVFLVTGQDPHGSAGGQINFDGKGTITDGIISSSYSFSGMGYSRTFSDFAGTVSKETASGTFSYKRYLFNGWHDTTLTGKGTFELMWLYEKDPKLKKKQ